MDREKQKDEFSTAVWGVIFGMGSCGLSGDDLAGELREIANSIASTETAIAEYQDSLQSVKIKEV